jgi:cob(I)alamin adenosyltransferase
MSYLGDKGKVKLLNCKVIDKCECNIEVLGKLDALQAAIDYAHIIPPKITEIYNVSVILTKIGAELYGMTVEIPLDNLDIESLQDWLNENAKSEVTGFVTFNTESACRYNECRVRARDLERAVVCLAKKKKVRKDILAYLNKLSTYFFVIAVGENE